MGTNLEILLAALAKFLGEIPPTLENDDVWRLLTERRLAN
jgi:hypothetical protein